MREAEALDLFWARCAGPIVIGVNDCCMTLADTLAATGRADLMAAYRGRYASQLGFVRAFRRAGHGSLFAACEDALSTHGVRVQRPENFDAAVVGHPGPDGAMVESPAFFHGGFWHARSERGGLVLSHDVFEGLPRIYRVN